MMKKYLGLIILAIILSISACEKEPTCSDGKKNGSELEIDCGGDNCSPCCYSCEGLGLSSFGACTDVYSASQIINLGFTCDAAGGTWGLK